MSHLTFDDSGFGTEAQRIAWDDLVAVGVRTTTDGPLSEDVFWQFLLRDDLVEIAGSMLNDLGALSQRLPGLNFRKVITAMGSCKERIFRVWHHQESRTQPCEPVLRKRFVRLFERLGAGAAGDNAFTRLYAAWSSETRRYHDVEHLADCLREVEELPPSPTRDLVELALWYHDAICDAGANDNEHRSAAWLATDATALGIAEPLAQRAAALVESTAHGACRIASEDAALVADIDLAILGRDSLRFMDFEYGVEEEFGAVPMIAFRRGRGRFLASLLDGPIYRTSSFRDRFEVVARANVNALLRGRRYASYRWLRWLPG